jgi:preprotein translocase subunit SecD
MRRQNSYIALILVLVIASITVLTQVPIRLGLDLRGGSQLTIQLQTSEEIPTIDERVMEGVLKIVENRVNALGVSESVVQSLGQDQILVQLPGVNDPEQAERVLGGTAQLDFREQLQSTEQQLGIEYQVQRQLLVEQELLKNSEDQEAIEKNLKSIEKTNQAIAELFKAPTIKGQDLRDALAEPVAGSKSDNWNVALRFTSEGGEKFAELTKNLAGTGRSIGIFLDDKLLSAPTVSVEFAETGITGGNAVIQGRFTAQQANDLAVQLRGGALPVSVAEIVFSAVSMLE